jgi:uncharacterized membrane protein YdjX (TVP38/TMEM64 family)
LLLALALLGAVGGFVALGLQHEFTLDAIRAHRLALSGLCQAHPVLAPLAYFAIYVSVAALTLPLNVPLSVGAGALFGVAEGAVVVSFASAIGATLSMLSSRFLLRDMVNARFGRRLAEVEAGVARNGMFYLLALRLAPMVPYTVVNLLFGLTAISALRFYAVTQLGTLPTLLIFVNAGRRLDEVDSLRGVLSPGLLAALLLLATVPLLARAASARLMAGRD